MSDVTMMMIARSDDMMLAMVMRMIIAECVMLLSLLSYREREVIMR